MRRGRVSSGMPISRALSLVAFAVLPAVMASPPKPTFAVVPVGINNITPLPDTPADSAAVVTLTHEARARLATCGYPLISDSAGPPAAAGHAPTYLFQHPEVVAAWGAEQHADWVLVSRMNRTGPWAVQWEVQVVSTKQQQAVDQRVIDLRGVSRDSGISAHMATRGAAWVIDQSLQAVAHAEGDTTNGGRPCRA
jgi:hypothetical protein